MTDRPSVVVWFRDDLRLADNPALAAAAETGAALIPIYLIEDDERVRPLGGASRWWLHHSLTRLTADLAALGCRLIIRPGRAADVIPAVARESGARRVFWNRRYGNPAAVDAEVANALGADSVAVSTFKANLLFEPHEIVSGSGKPFRVYSAFWRAAMASGRHPRPPLPAPKLLAPCPTGITGDDLDSLGLLPTRPDWAAGLRETWTPGEASAASRLATFVEDDIAGYATGRDFPAEPATSQLSPHLRFGEISPFQIWDAVERVPGAEKFRAEIGWREFAWHLLADVPDMATRNIRAEFDRFPWAKPGKALAAWQRGETGYPIVDAGMRQLWQTGWMHNRVRMVVASFLTKHLLIDWREGEAWFWDTLVDADAANNPFGWQWVAGSGADAQPYFRIFNPVLQGEKFDPQGVYVRRYVPELAALPDAFIHKPWEASPIELAAAGVDLGRTYPRPIVDHAVARERALAAFARVKAAN